MIAYDSKSAYGVLARGLGAVLGRCQDPQIASWLLDPGAREKTLHNMVTNFLPEDLPLLEGKVWFASVLFYHHEPFIGIVSNLVFLRPVNQYGDIRVILFSIEEKMTNVLLENQPLPKSMVCPSCLLPP